MNGQHHGGKGTAQRPKNTAKFESNWDAIFGPKTIIEKSSEMPRYLAILSDKTESELPFKSWLFDARNILEAKELLREYESTGKYDIVVQSVASIYLNNDLRINSQPFNRT